MTSENCVKATNPSLYCVDTDDSFADAINEEPTVVKTIFNSVSNTGNTETGFPVFGSLNTDTGKILAVLPVLERI
jgi:hypothetical protein